MSHTHRSPLRSGIARTLRYAPRSARAELGRVAVGRLDADAATWPRVRDVAAPWAFD